MFSALEHLIIGVVELLGDALRGFLERHAAHFRGVGCWEGEGMRALANSLRGSRTRGGRAEWRRRRAYWGLEEARGARKEELDEL